MSLFDRLAVAASVVAGDATGLETAVVKGICDLVQICYLYLFVCLFNLLFVFFFFLNYFIKGFQVL